MLPYIPKLTNRQIWCKTLKVIAVLAKKTLDAALDVIEKTENHKWNWWPPEQRKHPAKNQIRFQLNDSQSENTA